MAWVRVRGGSRDGELNQISNLSSCSRGEARVDDRRGTAISYLKPLNDSDFPFLFLYVTYTFLLRRCYIMIITIHMKPYETVE